MEDTLENVQPIAAGYVRDKATTLAVEATTASLLGPLVTLQFEPQAPFAAIRGLFDYLRANPQDAERLDAIYPTRGIFKTAATHNAASDQKFTIDLFP